MDEKGIVTMVDPGGGGGGGDYASLLVVILDANPFYWTAEPLKTALPLDFALADILVFLNAHLAISHTNRVAFIACHNNSATYLYPDKPSSSSNNNNNKSALHNGSKTGYYRPFQIVDHAVKENLQRLFDQTTDKDLVDNKSSTLMAGALSLGLSYINRVTQQDFANTSTIKSRILILSVSSDLSAQYIPMMNLMFGAQKKRIPIDVVKLGQSNLLLDQAADASGGLLTHLKTEEDLHELLQYLMSMYLSDQQSRKHLILGQHHDVDFRAACFCHKRIVDIGYVCSVCLSIYCQVYSSCMVCSTQYDGAEMKRLKKRGNHEAH